MRSCEVDAPGTGAETDRPPLRNYEYLFFECPVANYVVFKLVHRTISLPIADDRFFQVRQHACVVEAIWSVRSVIQQVCVVGYDLAVTLSLPIIGGCSS